jgi:hypothetical protein
MAPPRASQFDAIERSTETEGGQRLDPPETPPLPDNG